MNKLVEAIAKRLIERGIRKPPDETDMDDDDTRFWKDGSVLQSHVEIEVYAILKAIDPEKDGWKLVPNEATYEILKAAGFPAQDDDNRIRWEKMLAAVPDPLGDD